MSVGQNFRQKCAPYPVGHQLLPPLPSPTQAQNLLCEWSPQEVNRLWLETGQPTHLPRPYPSPALSSTEPHSIASALCPTPVKSTTTPFLPMLPVPWSTELFSTGTFHLPAGRPKQSPTHPRGVHSTRGPHQWCQRRRRKPGRTMMARAAPARTVAPRSYS